MQFTNATKAVVGGVISAAINLALLFGVDISVEQAAGINVFVDAVLVAVVAFTYKSSPKRVPEGYTHDEAAALLP